MNRSQIDATNGLAAFSEPVPVVVGGGGGGVDGRDCNGRSALWHAAWRGKLEEVIHLAEQPGASLTLLADNSGRSPLYAASGYNGGGGHVAVVRWLAGKGLSVTQTDNDGGYPLSIAAENGHLEVVQWLTGNGGSVAFLHLSPPHILTHHHHTTFTTPPPPPGRVSNKLTYIGRDLKAHSSHALLLFRAPAGTFSHQQQHHQGAQRSGHPALARGAKRPSCGGAVAGRPRRFGHAAEQRWGHPALRRGADGSPRGGAVAGRQWWVACGGEVCFDWGIERVSLE